MKSDMLEVWSILVLGCWGSLGNPSR